MNAGTLITTSPSLLLHSQGVRRNKSGYFVKNRKLTSVYGVLEALFIADKAATIKTLIEIDA